MKAVEKELKRAGIAVELEGGEGKFNIQNVGDTKITITATIESHAVEDFKDLSRLNESCEVQ
jgi:hypothetical protein